jgi:acyl-CoA thioester hydrolase
MMNLTADTVVGEARFRVRYAETDKMGVVYNSNYLIWFEIGRVELMRELGHSYREVEEAGYIFPVAEVTCRYKGPAYYDDEILIKTRILRLRRTLVDFGYEVFRAADEKLLATGNSCHLVVGTNGERRPLAEQYMEAFRRALEPAAGS